MLEIYLYDGCQEESLRPFLERLVKFQLAYTIKKAPRKHKEVLGGYLEAAYKQAGIWGLPVEKGTMRMLCTSELVQPIPGQTVILKRKDGIQTLMVASHPDPDVLCSVALHELGHALKAVRRRTHDCVMVVKARKEMAIEAARTLINEGALEKLGELYPESMVELNGAHCLDRMCVMWPQPSERAIKVEKPFCDICFKNVTEEIKKVNEEFERVKEKCGDCVYLRKCMRTKEWVWEGADTCDEFSADPTKQVNNTPPAQQDDEE